VKGREWRSGGRFGDEDIIVIWTKKIMLFQWIDSDVKERERI
jgi:hypothetical protein